MSLDTHREGECVTPVAVRVWSVAEASRHIPEARRRGGRLGAATGGAAWGGDVARGAVAHLACDEAVGLVRGSGNRIGENASGGFATHGQVFSSEGFIQNPMNNVSGGFSAQES